MKKNVTMQILSITVMLAFLCMPLVLNAQGSKANFSGKWAFNAEKSEMGQGGGRMRMGGGDLTVSQEANLLTVERTRQGRDGQTMNFTSKYTLDGKESVNTNTDRLTQAICNGGFSGFRRSDSRSIFFVRWTENLPQIHHCI